MLIGTHPAKARVKHHVTGAFVYEVGNYEITVPVDDAEADAPAVTYQRPYRSDTSPRSSFPNMEVRDGQLVIPFEDLIDEIISRADPAELAKALWQNDEVKQEFMDCLCERWSEAGIDDADRRRFLHRIKEAVHSKALDKAATAAASAEYHTRNMAHFSHQIYQLNDWLKAQEIRRADGEIWQIKGPDRDPDFAIGGRHWNEARDHWRQEFRASFADPEAPQQPSEEA